MPYMYFNFQYLAFMLPAILLSFIAQIMVKSTYAKYSKVLNRRGLTGAMAAEQVLWGNHVPASALSISGGTLPTTLTPAAM